MMPKLAMYTVYHETPREYISVNMEKARETWMIKNLTVNTSTSDIVMMISRRDDLLWSLSSPEKPFLDRSILHCTKFKSTFGSEASCCLKNFVSNYARIPERLPDADSERLQSYD